MSLPYPTDPSLPANPTPVFSDTTAARGDHLRANNSEIWANFSYLIGSPTLTGLNLSGLTASKIVETDASKNLVSVAKGTSYNKNFETNSANIKPLGTVALGASGNVADASHVHTSALPDWAVSTAYTTGQMVKYNNSVWFCLVNHTSTGVFGNDWISTGYWVPVGDGPGMIKMWGNSNIPAGYLNCNGALVSRSTYALLFTLIGSNFGGGDLTTTFQLPDFGGISPVGGSTGNHLKDKNNTGSYFTAALATYYQDMMFSHYHASNNVTGIAGTGPFTVASGGGSAAVGVLVKEPTTDSVNGTPNSGTKTQGPRLGIIFIIKY